MTQQSSGQSDIEAAYEHGTDRVRVVVSTAEGRVALLARPNGDGMVAIDTVDLEKYQAQPRREQGNATFRDIESFNAYVLRHKSDATVAFANDKGGIRAVFNHHDAANGPGWRDFTASLARPHTKAFKAWMDAAREPLTQLQFANFLEERLGEIVEPAGAGLLEAAEEFRAHRSLRFRSQNRLANGQRQIEYIEQVEGGTEAGGKLTLPEVLTVRLQPFRDSEAFAVNVRLRWNLDGSAVKFALLFDDTLEGELERIYDEAIAAVAAATDVPVLRGTDA